MQNPRRRLFLIAIVVLTLLPVAVASAQEISTAESYFASVAETYGAIENYIATMRYTDDAGTWTGTLLFKRPNKIRIDFDTPEGQYLVTDGEVLMVYVPAFDVVLRQELGLEQATQTPGGLLTPGGLSIMRRNFDIAYLEGPEPVPLDPDSDVYVTQLRLDRKQVTEGYRRLVLSVDASGYIRRLVGTLVDWREVQMDLSNIQINQVIPDARFEEDPDAAASIHENFLFDPER